MNTIIELKGIGRTYTNSSQPLTVLKNINLKIAAGELVAIITSAGITPRTCRRTSWPGFVANT